MKYLIYCHLPSVMPCETIWLFGCLPVGTLSHCSLCCCWVGMRFCGVYLCSLFKFCGRFVGGNALIVLSSISFPVWLLQEKGVKKKCDVMNLYGENASGSVSRCAETKFLLWSGKASKSMALFLGGPWSLRWPPCQHKVLKSGLDVLYATHVVPHSVVLSCSLSDLSLLQPHMISRRDVSDSWLGNKVLSMLQPS